MTQQPSRYSFTWLGEPRNAKVEVGQATISSSEAAEPPGGGIKATASESIAEPAMLDSMKDPLTDRHSWPFGRPQNPLGPAPTIRSMSNV